ncbi:MAG TPA: hypothetical protein VGY77_09050 [Gemmataceae bacterium]|jgi:hypothetical protein|nr:hypothetical protein [Gemmataceae bacterium]
MWFRVFGTSVGQPEPGAILEHLHNLGFPVEANFRGDEQGWFEADLAFSQDNLRLQCFRIHEEGLRNELNTWAAWLETAENSPHASRLMQHVIGTNQLFTLEVSDDTSCLKWGVALCLFLARTTAGVYQIDGQGFFDADGSLLIGET